MARATLYRTNLTIPAVINMRQSIRRLLRRWKREVIRVSEVPIEPIDVLNLVLFAWKQYRDIRFIQVGAYDGRRGDPLHRYISRYHWSGILLEPQPMAFQALKATYAEEPQLLLENCALADRDGSVRLYTIENDLTGTGYEAMCASIDRKHMRRTLGSSTKLVGIDVPSVSVRTLLKRHDFQKFDLLQVDTEGFDAQIIDMFIRADALPPIVQFEHIHLKWTERQKCLQNLYHLGYHVHVQSMDTLAVHSDLLSSEYSTHIGMGHEIKSPSGQMR